LTQVGLFCFWAIMYSVYILYSEKLSKFYIGYSSNVLSRQDYHNSEANVIWTSKGKPWQAYFVISDLSESQAIRIEKHIKKMKSRKYIENLKKYPEIVEKLRARYI
ncbi:GIY-YIG nuclease family protein, partial [Fulvivirga kasyanovii]